MSKTAPRCRWCRGRGWYAYRVDRAGQVDAFDPNSPRANSRGWVRTVCICPAGILLQAQMTPDTRRAVGHPALADPTQPLRLD